MDQKSRDQMTERVFFRATPLMVERVATQARQEDRSPSEVARRAVEQYLALRANLGSSYEHVITPLLGQQR